MPWFSTMERNIDLMIVEEMEALKILLRLMP